MYNNHCSCTPDKEVLDLTSYTTQHEIKLEDFSRVLYAWVVTYAIVNGYVTDSNVITIWRTSAIKVTALLKKNLRSETKGVQEKESIMGVRGR